VPLPDFSAYFLLQQPHAVGHDLLRKSGTPTGKMSSTDERREPKRRKPRRADRHPRNSIHIGECAQEQDRHCKQLHADDIMTFNAKLLTATAAALIGAIALTGCNEAPAPAPAAEPAAQTQPAPAPEAQQQAPEQAQQQAPAEAQKAPEQAPAPDAKK
jgi:hypothetical protein